MDHPRTRTRQNERSSLHAVEGNTGKCEVRSLKWEVSRKYADAALGATRHPTCPPLDNGTTPALQGNMPPRDLIERTRVFALDVVRFCRTLPSTDDPALLAEAHELASILGAAVRTARTNTARVRQVPPLKA